MNIIHNILLLFLNYKNKLFNANIFEEKKYYIILNDKFILLIEFANLLFLLLLFFYHLFFILQLFFHLFFILQLFFLQLFFLQLIFFQLIFLLLFFLLLFFYLPNFKYCICMKKQFLDLNSIIL